MNETMNDLKGFWDRTEGKAGKLVIAAISVATGLFLWNYSGQIVTMLQNTLQAMILLGTIATLFALATSQDVQRNISAIFKVVMYNLTNAIVAIDPIAVAKGQIRDAEKILLRLDDMISQFTAQVKGLQETIRRNEGKIKMATEYMAEANKQYQAIGQNERDTAEARAKQKARIINARTAQRKTESNKTYQDLLALAERILKQLLRARDSADLLIQVKKDDIEEREQRYKMSTSIISVINKVKKLKGALQDNVLYDAAIEAENARFAESLGALQNFTETSADFLVQSDLANGIYETAALKRLEELDFETGIDTRIQRDGVGSAARTSSGQAAQVKTGTSGYGDLFR